MTQVRIEPIPWLSEMRRIRLQKLGSDEIKKRVRATWQETQVPTRFRKLNFECLDGTEDPRAHEIAREFAEKAHYRGNHGLVLLGKPGCGKTSLAVATMRQVLESSCGDVTMRFWNVPDGLGKIKEGFNQGSLEILSNVVDEGRLSMA